VSVIPFRDRIRHWSLRFSVLLVAACHVGAPRPTLPADGYRVLPVLAPVADAGLPEVLEREVAAALAARGMLGQGQSVQLEVIGSSSETTASGPSGRGERARLVVGVRLLGAAPAQVVLQAERAYHHSSDLGATAAEQRRQAQEALATELARQLADWLVAYTSDDRRP